MHLFWTHYDTFCCICPRNGKPVSVMVFIIFGGKSSVALYNTIIRLSTIETIKKNDSIKLLISYFLCYFCHVQICNDDCWVICSLSCPMSNTLLVKYIYTPNGVCVRACFASAHVFVSRRGGGFNMSRPRGPWFLNPSMSHPCPTTVNARLAVAKLAFRA